MANIYEVMAYGPIVFVEEDVGVLITVNGSYFNWWVGSRGTWENTDCRPTDLERGLYEEGQRASLKQLMERAEAWFVEVMRDQEQEHA